MTAALIALEESMARRRILAAARSWLRTPHVNAARVKGAGVDCGQLLAAVYEEAGLISRLDTGWYPHDWHLHRGEERFLGHVEQYARPVEVPGAGDIALFRFGRCISHGAIVTEWPQIIHAYVGLGVLEDDALANTMLAGRLAGFWSVFA